MNSRLGSAGLGVLAAGLLLCGTSQSGAYAATPSAQQVCSDAPKGFVRCMAMIRTFGGLAPLTEGADGMSAFGVTAYSAPDGYGPADLASAYSVPGGTAGTGMTVAIVDAYDLPTAESDLAAYRSAFGLPPCTTANGCFRKVNQRGGTTYPRADAGWGFEIALDTQMVSAICPNCNILLVEADNPSLLNMGIAVNTAAAMGAVAISNSYGTPEFDGETYYNSYYDHPGIAVTVSTGDCGWNCAESDGERLRAVSWPATSPYAIAVGGTSLTRPGGVWHETAWGGAPSAWAGGAGAGCSLYEPKPSWQTDPSCSMRMTADVSAVADPYTGVAVYRGGWGVMGGTSASAPIIAAMYALAGRPGIADYPASYLYANSGYLRDVVGGNSDVTWGDCAINYLCRGVAGYDGPTGLGTPNGLAAFATAEPTPSTYHALDPVRILDTRFGTGGLSGKFQSRVPRTFQVTGGTGPVPTGAVAVTGILGVLASSSAGSLYIGVEPSSYPDSAAVKFPYGDDRANMITTALPESGALSITYTGTYSTSTANVSFDVTGYFTADETGSTFHTLAPTRMIDTRDGRGGFTGKVTSGSAREFQIADAALGGVPDDAIGVTGLVGVIASSTWGNLYVGPQADPPSLALHFPFGDDRVNPIVSRLSDTGTLTIKYVGSKAGASAYLIFDVTGYFTADATGATFVPLRQPIKIMDSGTGLGGYKGPYRQRQPRTFQVAGLAGVSADAIAVTGILSEYSSNTWGNLFIGPDATANPDSFTIHYPKADNRVNAVIVDLSDSPAPGTLSATIYGPYSTTYAYVAFWCTGYFLPPSA